MSDAGMNPTKKPLPGGVVLVLGLMCVAGAMAFGVSVPETGAAPSPLPWQTGAGGLGLLALWASLAAGLGTPSRARTLALVSLSLLAALCWLKLPPALGETAGGPGFWLGVLGLGALAVVSIQRAAVLRGRWGDAWLAAVLFGAWLLVFWQLLTQALDVPRVLLPAPSFIAASMVEHAATLWGDFVQTVGKAVVVGWVLGCGLGFGVAIAIDRAPFLQRGLLPLASLTSTVPLVGVAPIAVMWFGFDWPSKAAVVVLMTFFPMLVSTLAGLKAADTLQRELMHTYAATYLQTLRDLRLPSAFPHVVGAMKVNATLALIGAIVAEFFGSPTSGLGFRISTEAARMNMPLVWGAIAVAAVTGSVGYALLVKLERRVAFWHPSVRSAG